MARTHYKVHNWREYNQALKERYRITVLIDEEVSSGWYGKPSGKRGAPRRYSDLAVTFALTMRVLLRLPLRGCEGFLQTLLKSSGLAVPDYTTLSRRGKTLSVRLPQTSRGENIWLVVDSSGLKIYGEGEWKVRMHGVGKRRTWRKLHIGVDASTGEIVAGALTTADVHDSEMLPDLLEEMGGAVEAVSGDGAYDMRDDYKAISKIGAKAVIPPRRGAKIWRHGNCGDSPLERDENLRYIRKHGRKKWKEESGYHRRSLAETAFFRIKTIFGDRLRSRDFDNQATEAFLRLSILNRMTALGMPDSYPVSD
jgi:transposase